MNVQKFALIQIVNNAIRCICNHVIQNVDIKRANPISTEFMDQTERVEDVWFFIFFFFSFGFMFMFANILHGCIAFQNVFKTLMHESTNKQVKFLGNTTTNCTNIVHKVDFYNILRMWNSKCSEIFAASMLNFPKNA